MKLNFMVVTTVEDTADISVTVLPGMRTFMKPDSIIHSLQLVTYIVILRARCTLASK